MVEVHQAQDQELLRRHFDRINHAHFDGFLDAPVLRWNSRLRSAAGRFIPGSRKFWHTVPPIIEVASYLHAEVDAQAHIVDTLAHEMIHYWLWVRRKPYGHTAEFMAKLKLMGASRYNPVPKIRPYRYVYVCATCEKEFPARRRLGALACGVCCKRHSGGKYDSRFKLTLNRSLDRQEGLELARQRRAAAAPPPSSL